MNNNEEKKAESEAKEGDHGISSASPKNIDYYHPVVMTRKCYGLLQYSDTPSKGQSFKCQGIERMYKAFVINGPGNTPVQADHALHVFQHDVDARHYQGSSDSGSGSIGSSSSDGGFGGGNRSRSGSGGNGYGHGHGRSKTLQERMNGSNDQNIVPPEQWKLVKDRKFDELQSLLENHQSNASSGVYPGKSGAGVGAAQKTTTMTKEFHANIYGVTEVESLIMTKVDKNHKMPTEAEADTNTKEESHANASPFPNTFINMDRKAMKTYKIVPVNKYGVAKRTLRCIEDIDDDGTKKEYIVSATTSRLGFIEIDMQGFEEILHVDETDMDMDELDDWKKDHTRSNDDDDEKKMKNQKPNIGLQPLSPSSNSSIIPTMNELKEFNDKFDAASTKIISHMKANAKFLYKEITQDDFYDRTMNAGERIVVAGGKNIERMKKMMMNGYKWLQDSGW